MEAITTSAKIDFANFLSLALNKSLPWNYLFLIVNNMTLNEEESKNIIKVLLKELQQLQAKQEISDTTLMKASLEKAELEIVESDVASENDYESVKDISENEVSLIDPENKQIDYELLNNDEQIAVESNSEKESIHCVAIVTVSVAYSIFDQYDK